MPLRVRQSRDRPVSLAVRCRRNILFSGLLVTCGFVVLLWINRESFLEEKSALGKLPRVEHVKEVPPFHPVQAVNSDSPVLPMEPVVDSNVPSMLSQQVITQIPVEPIVAPVPVELSCRQPDLDVNDPAIAKFFKPTEPISCDASLDYVCIDRGVAHVCEDTLRQHPDTKCKYTFLKRESDLLTIDGEQVNGGQEPVTMKSDFFKVSCNNSKWLVWNNKWTSLMAGIAYDPAIHSRAGWDKVPVNNLRLNVLIWGFDSLSRNTFMRKLPKTHAYLVDELGAIILKGYNIVGDGTPQALIPILTGKTELELPDTRKRIPGTQYVNVYPYVWKDYENKGYVTAYAEDSPRIGTFTYRLRGFKELPTSHYMRPFYIAAEQGEFVTQPCMGGIPRHKIMMNWVRHFFAMYQEKPKFMFNFHSELSHGDYNKVGAADEDFLDLIRSLKSDGHLNNTLLIIMSDHGHRFAAIREYQQGKQEERLPFFSFTFPSWVEKKYPEAVANFRTNAERLSTPFDIYPTLMDVLDFQFVAKGNTQSRGISLFSEIPPTRTCQDAAIEPHWCTCLNWKELPVDDQRVVRAANALVRAFNQLTEPQRHLCETLTLDQIVWAGWFLPTNDLLKFSHAADLDGFVPDLSSGNFSNIEIYQLKIFTSPGGGHFEATLKHDALSNTYSVKEEDISRINKYGRAAECIEGTEEQLRKFCYCKK